MIDGDRQVHYGSYIFAMPSQPASPQLRPAGMLLLAILRMKMLMSAGQGY